MKLSDLMIGDWVYVENVHKPVRVTSIGYTVFANYEHFQEVDGSVYGIQPIEVTKEILHKNGFDGDGYLWLNVGDEKTLEYYPFEHRLNLWCGEGKNQEILFKCQCFSVHELQHALKLCGINKEIVL